MVHSIGSGRMAVMARLLAPGSISQTITEDVGYSKLAAQYTYKELREADEANLLDEDDMHVFGLKPTTDPLNLVRCNDCKKPVKASQFATHAELCKSLSSAEVIVSKLDNVARRKKPPRKERKKSSKVYAIQPTLVRDREHLETLGSHESAPSSSHLNEQMQLTSSSPMEAKGEYRNGSKVGSGKTSNHVGRRMPRQVTDCYIPTRDVPAPLATKIYYSQRDQRLRCAISDLYKTSTD